jgi:hypothetical protein
MKKQNKKNEDEMLKEYDFSNGIRGKYAKKYAAGTNIILLEPDLAKYFKDSKEVNETLRNLLKVARQVSKVAM